MRQCSRIRRGLGVPPSVVYVLLVYLCSPASAHIPEINDDIRIEPTPVLMAGPSSSQILGFIRYPLEGSNRRRQNDYDNQEDAEGSGFGRTKRDYSLEDFLVWMASGDGSTEEWQHRPRDTSWMRREVTTTTVYLTTTVYTTVVPAPFTPSTFTSSAFSPSINIQPSSVTPVIAPPTKYPDYIPESANSVHIIDRGGGKNLDDSFSSTVTTSDFPNSGGNTSPTFQERPQSDYASSHNSGNVIPGSPTAKDKTTEKQAKTSFITVTKTVTSPPTQVHVNKPIVTTTSSFDESQYDITDLVHTSLEYPGPSATVTISSVTPTLVHGTHSMQTTLSPTSRNSYGYPSTIAQPTSSDTHVPVTPTAVFSSTTDNEYHTERETPILIVPTTTSPSSDNEANIEVDTRPSEDSSSNSEHTILDTTTEMVDIIDINYSTTVTEKAAKDQDKFTGNQDLDSTTEEVITNIEIDTPYSDGTSHSPHYTTSIDWDSSFMVTEPPLTPVVIVSESSIPTKDGSKNYTNVYTNNETLQLPDDKDTTDTIYSETDTAMADETQVTLMSTLLPGESTINFVTNDESLTSKTDYYQTTPSSVFSETVFTSSSNESDVTLDGNDFDFSTENDANSTMNTPIYTSLVPNSTTDIPLNESEFSDTPFLASTAGVDVVDPAPIDAEEEIEIGSEKTTTFTSDEDYSTTLQTNYTLDLEDQFPEESITSYTEDTTIQFSSDFGDVTTESIFPFNNTIKGNLSSTAGGENASIDYDTNSDGLTVPQIESDVITSTMASEFDLEEELNRTSKINGSFDKHPENENEYNITLQISPTEATISHISSGVEASLSVILLPGQSNHVTQPFEIITPSALPSLPYPGDSSSINASDYDSVYSVPSTENDTTSFGFVHPTLVSATTVQYELSSVNAHDSSSLYPTLQPSLGTSEESDISSLTSTISLPSDKSITYYSTVLPNDHSVSTNSPESPTKKVTTLKPTTDEEQLYDTSDIVSYTSDPITSTAPSNVSVPDIIKTSLITTVSQDTSLTPEFSSEEKTQQTLHPTTSDIPILTATTTVEDSILITTHGGSLTPSMDSTVMPKMTTTLTTGAQPSPPSPSNNATVPLDQRYWVRTVLEGPPKEDDPVTSWSRIQSKLTNAYQIAFKRSTEALKYGVSKNQNADINSGNQVTTVDPTAKVTISPTTVNPYENYTTIIGRRKREIVQNIHKATMPLGNNLIYNAIIPSPSTYRMSTGLRKHKGIVLLQERKFKKTHFINNTEKYLPSLPVLFRNVKVRNSAVKDSDASNTKSVDQLNMANPFLSSRTLKAALSYSLSVPVAFSTWHKRIKRTVPENVSVRLHNVTYDNVTDSTELVYTVFDGEWPILAIEAVGNMSTIDDMEMAVLLDQVVHVKAEEYLSSPPLPDSQRDVYVIIGGVVGGVMLLVFVLWCAMFVYRQKTRDRETLQPDSQEVTPRSQLSTNAYVGHINLGYSTNRDEKSEAAPLPSTSQPMDDDLGRSSPSGSHDHLIRPRQGPSFGSASKLDQHFYKRKGRGDRGSANTSREGSVRDGEDYATTEEEEDDDDDEATTLRRPKSSIPWKKTGNRMIMDEPVYSSPKPISSQDLTGHSMNSRFETTHSEMSSSDPTHQLMANMLRGAQIFTSKDQGSIFLPPPLLPPPKGFGKSQDSPFIPGTSLPRFLPPPRPAKDFGSTVDGLTRRIPSQIDAYSYDPEAPPIPPRNYTREEAGLPPLGDGSSPSRPPMKDAEVEARIESEIIPSTISEDRMRRPSESSSHLSDSGASEGSMPNVGRLRRRFHDLLDDAFSLLSGQRPGDKVTPLTTPTSARKIRSKSAAIQQRTRTTGVFEEEPDEAVAGRPWSAAAIQSTIGWKEAQVHVGVIPLDQSRSPKSAWGDSGRPGTSFGRPSSVPSGASRSSSVVAGMGRPSSGPSGTCRPGSGRSGRSITPVNMPPSSPDEAAGRRLSASITSVQSRANEALDPDTGLRASDPAVPLIRAIKEELKRFKGSVSTDTSNA